jgi:ribosome-binding factor A
MKPSKRSTTDLRALCAQVHPDDGVDPREVFSRVERRRDKRNRKTYQLCKQVGRAVALALAGECGDSRLQSLLVVRVEPAPDDTHVRVFVQPSSAGGNSEREALHRRLGHVRHVLRREVAAAITRKYAPELSFVVVPAEGEPP